MNPHIHAALLQSHPADLRVIARYILWVKARRRIHGYFYQPPAHWVAPARLAHWL